MSASSVSAEPTSFLSRFDIRDAGSWARAMWNSASTREKFNGWCYDHSFLICFLIQFLMLIMFESVEPQTLKKGYRLSGSMTAILVIMELMQLVFLYCAHRGMLRELMALYVRPAKVWLMYMSTLLAFAAMYFTFFCFSRRSFVVEGYSADATDDTSSDGDTETDLQTSNDGIIVFLAFFYFSGAIMTSTGFGDIAPSMWYAQMLTNSQMLIGAVYHVGVFGLTLSHFRTFQKITEQQADPNVVVRMYQAFSNLQWIQRVTQHPNFEKVRRFCIRYLALVSIVFQTLITLLLFTIPDPFVTLTPADGARYTAKIIVITIMVLLQSILFICVLAVSLRLVKKVNNKDLSASFLVQSYIATALLFGGIYFILFTATPHHQFSRNTEFDMTIFEVLYVFLHFSLTVMTTTGFGDVYARGVVARMFVLLEMLVSILYNAVIIGLGTSQLIDMQAAKAEAEFQKVREWKSEAEMKATSIDKAAEKGNPFEAEEKKQRTETSERKEELSQSKSANDREHEQLIEASEELQSAGDAEDSEQLLEEVPEPAVEPTEAKSAIHRALTKNMVASSTAQYGLDTSAPDFT